MKSSYHPFRSAEAQTEYHAYYDKAAQAWPVPYESKMIDTSFGQTFVRISGSADAPPLVLFAGAGTSSLMWALSVAELSKHYRCYAFDSLIHTGCLGRSIPSRAISNASEAVQWLDEFFDGLTLGDGLNLLGASFGAWLASQYLLHKPKRLKKLVLVAPAGVVLPFRGQFLMRSILMGLLPFRATIQDYFRFTFPELLQKDPQILEPLVDDFYLNKRCFVPLNPLQLPRFSAMVDSELQAIKLPTLVLIGENDVIYSPQAAIQRLQKIAPEINAELIPNAGHDILLVQTEMLNQKILAFLTKA